MRRVPDRLRLRGGRGWLVLVLTTGSLVLAGGVWAPAHAQQAGLTIHVVPAFAGARFALDGQVFESDASGVASISVQSPGTHVLEALEIEDLGTMRATFSRWGDDFFQPRRDIELPRVTPLEVGYDVSHPVTLTFVGRDGEKVDASRVSSFTIRSGLGAVEEYKDPGPHWFQAVRILRRSIGLEAKELQYSLESVEVDGSNVVNRAEQRFYIKGKATWEIRLLLYSVHFSTQDALFGSPVGSRIVIEYPDGTERRVQLADDGTVTVDSLARGSYMAWVEASGISPPMPIIVSRDAQETRLKVITLLDVGAFVFVLAGTAIALAFIGRPRLRSAVRSKLRFRWGVLSDERL
ncbi:MAG TPA: hypothetical protein VFH75_04435, partial [Actinomycetota bacterium]|nr:hypothetical protein [Actinomycetota bacterium]